MLDKFRHLFATGLLHGGQCVTGRMKSQGGQMSEGGQSVTGKTKCHREDKVSQGRQIVKGWTKCHMVDNLFSGFTVAKKYWENITKGQSVTEGPTVIEVVLSQSLSWPLLRRDQVSQGQTVTKVMAKYYKETNCYRV
jgi:hypothetical protein